MISKKSPQNISFDFRKEILKADPVSFAQNYLTVDGTPINLSGGWKFWSDIYRLIGISAFKKDAKPIVLLKGRQCGATTCSTAMELYFATSGMCGGGKSPPARIVHCFPDLGKVQLFAKEKFSNMIRTSVNQYVPKQLFGYTDEGQKTQDNTETLTFKQFKNECRILIESNANNATRLQSSTNDIIFYDEIQHMRDQDVGNANRTLTASNYGPIGSGSQVYFGTPLNKGSYFWKIWESSDQRFYHLRCVSCDHYFQLYEYGSDSWEQIWIAGNAISCPSCHKIQDKVEAISGGKWIATRNKTENGQEPRFIGFHIGQHLIPRLTKESILKEKPGIHPTNTDRVYRNEILGEFYSGADLPMSEDIIYDKCRELDKRISFGIVNDNVQTFLGIDWGKKTDGTMDTGGKSFSTVAVISVDGSGTIRVLNAFKLKKNDLQHKKDVVDEMFRRYNIKIAVADLGYANDTVPEIQKTHGSKFIGCFNSSSLVNPYKYDIDDLRLVCNSNIVLEELFTLMRRGKVLFPWVDFEKISWLIEHCCSMEKETRVVNGQVINRFVKGTGPNDGLMSLLYAYLAWKFYQTRGFSLKPHMLNGGKGNGPGAILAHLPNM